MLEFISVSKKFGDITALEDVSFRIDEGEFVFITGPSGAGKTTLLRLLLREYPPTDGEIIFEDFKVHEMKKRDVPKLRQTIGTVFQDFQLLENRTIRENVEVPLAVKKVPRSEWDDRVEHVLKLVGLQDRIDLFPAQLSGGELQRAVIARALIVNPTLIFADEPTGNLDWETTEQIMELLQKINDEGKTIIVTTHNHLVVDKMKKRVLEVKGGKLVHDSHPKKVVDPEPESEKKPKEGKETEEEVSEKVEEKTEE